MLDMLENWKGKVDINGVEFDSVADAESFDFSNLDKVLITLKHTTQNSNKTQNIAFADSSNELVITVKSYMTKKATPSFDFMEKWNNNIPMPLMTMIGTKEKETRGMVYMKLHGDITATKVPCCMKCGKPLTNPVSQFFGMGPECGGHNYVSPFESDDELSQAVEQYRKEHLQKITWEGWIIKSAIIEEKEIER